MENNKHHSDDILDRKELKENPFGVPHDYFAAMKSEVMEKVACSVAQNPVYQEQESTPVNFFTYLKPAIALVAVFAFVFGIGWSTMKITGLYQQEADGVQIAGTQQTSNSGIEFTEDEIISILDLSEEDFITAQNGEEEDFTFKINKEEIEEYLIENRISTIQIAMLDQY